jgi:sulfatase maturation enzyme AslB (radical SAM superfamily)
VDTREAIDRGWFYVVEADGALVRRAHGWSARVEVIDASGGEFRVATLLRAAAAVGHAAERHGVPTVRVRLGPSGTPPDRTDAGGTVVTLAADWIASRPRYQDVDDVVVPLLAAPPIAAPAGGPLPARPTPRALFFESLMNSDLPHNDQEISQGVLHMIAPLRDSGTEVVLANVKMSITGLERPVLGMPEVERALATGPIGFVGITLLEGYYEGVVGLIREIRRLGCRAHIAVGGVMPTLTPEHVAAHLPDVSFVCRGAGEAFVTRLVQILGDADVDTPFTPAQRDALLAMDGLIAIDRAGRALIGANPAHVPKVEDLDAVALDLRHVLPRHITGGIELSTSRGCVHKCTFCSIIGRESYQARSADGIFAVLDRYDAHYADLYGEGPRDRRGRNTQAPPNAYRVHFSDDDFACDRDRALAFFERLESTPFRLSSAQVSIADLCRKDAGRVLPEPDVELLDAIRPTAFADYGAEVPSRDFVADHRSRSWSSFLQIGVETFSDRELVRLGKGYKLAHVRAIAAELDRRGLHFDAYFILSNADTTGDDLIDVLEEVCRLKLAHPRHFHIRFPVVPRLVSYFPSASYRRRVRQGTHDVSVLRGTAEIPGFREYDYPFVDYDRPRDPWTEAAVAAGYFTDERYYTGSFEQLAAIWRARLATIEDEAEQRRGEALLRRLDDAARHLAFEALARARVEARASGNTALESRQRTITASVVGPEDTWLRTFQRYTSESVPRLVVIPTWQCELRCNYCYIPKQDGRVMSAAILDRSLDMLLASRQPELMLQFFGGEALLEYPLVQRAIEHGTALAEKRGKRLQFVLSSNGWSLDGPKLDWLSKYRVKLELSLDGDPETQHKFRAARQLGADSYANGIAHNAAMIKACGLVYDVIMVVHPLQVHRLAHNFFHIASLGFERIQINFALGRSWNATQKTTFAAQLHAIGLELRARWARGDRLMLVNLENRPMPIRLNGEITVDWDGTVYGGNAFLHETAHKDKFVLGHLRDLANFDRYWLDTFPNEFLLQWSYPPDVTRNNLGVGAIMTSFLRWMYDAPEHAPRPAAPG